MNLIKALDVFRYLAGNKEVSDRQEILDSDWHDQDMRLATGLFESNFHVSMSNNLLCSTISEA